MARIRIGEIEIYEICKKLNCTRKQLSFCRQKVGDSLIGIEAFWSMNKDRIRKMFPENNSF